MRDSLDIEDEYFSVGNDFDCDRFTQDYFEYEQGQKDIIVKNRLRNHIDFWRKIGTNQFILDTILYGYKIPFYSLPPTSESKNNKSALQNCVFVREAISDLLVKGLIQKCDYVPKVVNPLSVSIQNNGKKRLILDLREVNKYVWKQKVKYEDLRIALMYIKQDSWMIRFDICSAYHFIDIRLPDTEYLAFAFIDEKGVNQYYKFLVLPFGLGVAPFIYTKLTRPLIAKWRGEGKKMIMFLDDGFGTADTLSLAKDLSQHVKSDLLDSGFIPKVDKCLWIPVQELEWLGVILNSIDFTICIPQRRVVKTISTLRELRRPGWVPVRKAASFVGQIISMGIVIGPVSQIMTRYISMDILQARTWNSYIKLSADSNQQLLFWENTLNSLNVRQLNVIGSCSKIVYSDASATGYAGYEVSTINGVSHGTWAVEEAVRSSTWRELCAVYRVLRSLTHVLSSHRVKWFTDNTNVVNIVNKGSMKPDLQDLAMQIFKFSSLHTIHLEIEWLPRCLNEQADYLSKIIEKDDWGISFEILSMLINRWGTLDIDYFASEHNAKLPVFFSKFWCYKSAGVDAFTFDWGQGFGLYVPPVILVSRVLRKMESCRAKGILVVPEWRSANFWPLICSSYGQMKSFVLDWMYLPTEKSFYTACKNGIGMFGTEDLKFNMLALYIQFT